MNSALLIIHIACFFLCFAIWLFHILTLVIYEHVIPGSITRKLLAVINFYGAFLVPEISIFLSMLFITADLRRIRIYYDELERRRIHNQPSDERNIQKL